MAATKTQSLSLDVRVVNLVGNTHFAVAELGGITIRGRKAESSVDALRNLLWKLSQVDHDDDDAEMAVELLVAGASIGDAVAELERGDD